jgi:anti-sigma factor RsiW
MTNERLHSPPDDLACIDAIELMTDYLEGALPAHEVQRLETHLGWCPGCADYLNQLRTIAGSLSGLTESSLPDAVRDDLIASFRSLRDA